MPPPDTPTVDQLAAQAEAAIQALAEEPDPAAFLALLQINRLVGENLGRSARNLAAASSWSQVGDYAATSKQAAWSRWSG